jgi:ATP-dependent Lon protease
VRERSTIAPVKDSLSPTPPHPETTGTLLVPVLPLKEVCLFPEASLATVVTRTSGLATLAMAGRSNRQLLAIAQLDPLLENPTARDMHVLGTLATVTEDLELPDGGRRVELDGSRRARVITPVLAGVMVAEIELLEEGDPGDHWGPAVEALARYLHAHADLRSFLDRQRRSREAMGWVNLACQHLPITSSARQKLLEADAKERCQKISRGLDALLRKEQGA